MTSPFPGTCRSLLFHPENPRRMGKGRRPCPSLVGHASLCPTYVLRWNYRGVSGRLWRDVGGHGWPMRAYMDVLVAVPPEPAGHPVPLIPGNVGLIPTRHDEPDLHGEPASLSPGNVDKTLATIPQGLICHSFPCRKAFRHSTDTTRF